MLMPQKQKPFLVLVAGLPASGKTWFAAALAEKLNAVHVNSDALRTELGLRGSYDTSSKQAVYDAMLAKGDAALQAGQPVVVDSTFFREPLRQPWLDLAEKHSAPFFLIEIRAPEAVIFQRLQQKREDSEANWNVYQMLKENWELIRQPYLVLNSHVLKISEMVELAEQYLAKS